MVRLGFELKPIYVGLGIITRKLKKGMVAVGCVEMACCAQNSEKVACECDTKIDKPRFLEWERIN